jgi:hypothetical protein
MHSNNDGLEHTNDQYLISDRELDQLAEAMLAWERNVRTAQWWETGDLDAYDAA